MSAIWRGSPCRRSSDDANTDWVHCLSPHCTVKWQTELPAISSQRRRDVGCATATVATDANVVTMSPDVALLAGFPCFPCFQIAGLIISLWPSDTIIRQHEPWSAHHPSLHIHFWIKVLSMSHLMGLVEALYGQVIACSLKALNHCLNQCWLDSPSVSWTPTLDTFTLGADALRNQSLNLIQLYIHITATSPRDQLVKRVFIRIIHHVETILLNCWYIYSFFFSVWGWVLVNTHGS